LERRHYIPAVAGARWLGKGDKLAADAAAVDAMRHCLSGVEFSGRVVIGEGEKDDAPMLHNGETVGTGTKPHVDIAVDPLDGGGCTS
jgi:fructose-1,6-bisphosphatase II